MPGGSSQILAYSSTNATNVFTLSVPGWEVANDAFSLVSWGVVLSKTKCHFFWISKTDSKIHSLEWDGVSTNAFTFADLSPLVDKGIGGTILNSGGTDYIAFTFIDSASQPVVVAYPEGNPAGKQVQTFVPVGLAPRSQAEISQNPRTKRVFLMYQVQVGAPNKTTELISADFTWPNTWTNRIDEQIGANNAWYPTPSFSVTGLPNFENAAPIRESGGALRDCFLKNGAWDLSHLVGVNGNPSSFFCKVNGADYLGTAVLTAFATPTLRIRPLAYPSRRAWNRNSRELYLEGPPLEGSTISVKTTFPELASASCRIAAVNQGAGLGLLQPSPGIMATGVIASAGTLIKLVFDESMMTASFPLWIGAETKIRVFDSASNPVPITDVASSPTELTFRLNADLAFNATYSVSIASGILDLGGTQLWAPATFGFVTQSAVSGSLASEVLGLEAYSDPSRAPGFLIPNNTEINASSSLWFRLVAFDPASNTIDLATLSPLLDGTALASLSMIQPAASSAWFHANGTFNAIPSTGTHLFRFQSASSTTFLQFPVSFPDLTAIYPASAATGITIDRKLTLTFSEPLATASVSVSSVRLLHDGVPSSYAVSLTGQIITIDPDDSAEGYLLTSSTYRIEVGHGVTDIVGNPFYPVPATWAMTFQTQPTISPPLTIASISLFADAGFSALYGPKQAIPATQTVFIQIIASDAATLTRDLSTATLQLPWGPTYTAILTEVASNSGTFRGSYTLSGIPLYGFPAPLPNLSVATLTWISQGAAPVSASLTIRFPEWQPSQSFLLATGGTVLASGGTSIALNSQVIVGFWPPVDSTTVASLTLTRSGTPVAVSRSVDVTKTIVTLTPVSFLAPDEAYEVSSGYSAGGIQSPEGNPLFRSFAFRFTTQPANAPPTTFASIRLFSDAAFTASYTAFQPIPATQTVYIQVLASDSATQTRDLSTATLQLPWGPTFLSSLTELASDSGTFRGSFNLGGIPLYGFPGPIPNQSVATLTWTSQGAAPVAASLTIRFPDWQPAQSHLLATGGTVLASGGTSIALNSPIHVGFWPPVDPSTVASLALTRNGSAVAASRSVDVSRTIVTLTPSSFLAPDEVYEVSSGYAAGGVLSPEGNPLFRPFAFRFSTQPANAPPATFTGLVLYRDAARAIPFLPDELISATQSVYLKVNAVDTATQTLDIGTITFSPSWVGPLNLTTTEIASNSGGIFWSQTNLASLPVYGFPAPQPPSSLATLAWTTSGTTPQTGRLRLSFPTWSPASSTLTNLSGSTILASGASMVRLSSPLQLWFDPPIASDSLSSVSIQVTNGSSVSFLTTIDDPGNRVTLTPVGLLQPTATYTVTSTYATNGLRSLERNPLYRGFSFRFSTQPSQTPPLSVTSLTFFGTAAYTAGGILVSDADFPASGTIFVEVVGSDASPLTIDSTGASTSTGLSLNLTETATNSGRFRGSFSLAGIADNQRVRAFSAINPAASSSVLITFPAVTPNSPASGATGVSLAATIRLQLSEDIDQASITSGSVQVFDVLGLATMTRTWLPASRQILLTPVNPLPPSTKITTQVNSLRDLVGNPLLASFSYTFSTQDVVFPPIVITQLSLFQDSSFMSGLPSNSLATLGTEVYIEVLGTDVSATSTDTTPVRIESSSGASFTISLAETGVNTGRFRGSCILFVEEDTVLTIRSITDPAYFQRLRLPLLPRVTGISPASGSTGLPLDTIFRFTTNKPLATGSVLSSAVFLRDKTGILAISPTLGSSQELILSGPLATNSQVFLEWNSTLRDFEGLSFQPGIASFSSRDLSISGFSVFRDPGFSQPATNGSFIAAGATVWAEILASDLRTTASDSLTVYLFDGTATVATSLMETSPGRYIGNFATPVMLGSALTITPKDAPERQIRLFIPGGFTLDQVAPASGAVGVPADTWPTWTFSQELDPLSVQVSAIGLLDPVTGLNVAGTLSISPNNKTVAFIPDAQLTLLKTYEMMVSATLRDKQGQFLGSDQRQRFAVQGPPPPPFTILSLKNFRDASFQTETTVVSPDGTMYLEVEGSDPLVFTVDSTRVRADSSDGAMAGVELTLIETGDDSGKYRAAVPVSAGGGSTINLRSQGNPLVKLSLQVLERPRVNSISPASGSIELPLDALFQIDFDKPIASATLASGVTAVDQLGNAIPIVLNSLAGGNLLTVSPLDSWATGSRHVVELSGRLLGIDGVGLSPLAFAFSTRTPKAAQLTLFTGTGPRPSVLVSSGSEALPGPLTLFASTTRLFERRSESRTLTIAVGGATMTVSITGIATAPGRFLGTAQLPNTPNVPATCTLLFANSPSLGFVIADRPALVDRSPRADATNVPEYSPITISTTRPMASDLASGALTLSAFTNPIPLRFTTPSSESTVLSWKPVQRLPFGFRCDAASTTLYDRLGQVLTVPATSFTVGGLSGINLYLDASFTVPLLSDVIPGSPIFVELAVPDGIPLEAGKPLLAGIPEHQASSPRFIPLIRIASESRRFRGRLDLAPQASGTIGTWIPLSPGERLELRRTGTLEPFSRSFYFLLKGDTPPQIITGLTLYEDKTYLKKAGAELIQSTLYIEIPAEDRNLWFSDTTRAHVFSDRDPQGFDVSLTETARHSGVYRGDFSIVGGPGNPSLRQLSAQPGNRITAVSATDPAFSQSLRWRPEGRLERVIGWPNPVRSGRFTLNFWLTWPGDVEIFIFDSAGDEVHTVFLRGKEGENRWNWDIPRRVANGVYFYTLEVHQSDAEFGEGKKKVRGKFAILR